MSAALRSPNFEAEKILAVADDALNAVGWSLMMWAWTRVALATQ